jgi:hypothetical protein
MLNRFFLNKIHITVPQEKFKAKKETPDFLAQRKTSYLIESPR